MYKMVNWHLELPNKVCKLDNWSSNNFDVSNYIYAAKFPTTLIYKSTKYFSTVQGIIVVSFTETNKKNISQWTFLAVRIKIKIQNNMVSEKIVKSAALPV